MAGFVWGVVMWLFYVKADILHESLASSMKDLYISSEKPIKTWKELIPYSNYKWEWYLMFLLWLWVPYWKYLILVKLVLNYIIFSDVQRSNCSYLENIFQND